MIDRFQLHFTFNIRFYSFESVEFQGRFIKSDYNGDLKLDDVNNRELFTGIKSNKHYTS